MTLCRSKHLPVAGRGASRRASARCAGFTLIEVMASLVLIGIALPAIMKGISMATNVAAVSRERAEAGALAESKLNELVSTNMWQTGTLSGEFSATAPYYKWNAEVNAWGQGMGVKATNTLTKLDVHVTWKEANSDQMVTVSTLVYAQSTAGLATGGTSSSTTGGTQ